MFKGLSVDLDLESTNHRKFKYRMSKHLQLNNQLRKIVNSKSRRMSISKDNLKFLPKEFQSFSMHLKNQTILSFVEEKKKQEISPDFFSIIDHMHAKGIVKYHSKSNF